MNTTSQAPDGGNPKASTGHWDISPAPGRDIPGARTHLPVERGPFLHQCGGPSSAGSHLSVANRRTPLDLPSGAFDTLKPPPAAPPSPAPGEER